MSEKEKKTFKMKPLYMETKKRNQNKFYFSKELVRNVIVADHQTNHSVNIQTQETTQTIIKAQIQVGC